MPAGRITPATTLQELETAELDLRAWCYACMRAETIEPLSVRAAPSTTIERLRSRLKCKQCGSKADVLIVPAKRAFDPNFTGARAVAMMFHAFRSMGKRRR